MLRLVRDILLKTSCVSTVFLALFCEKEIEGKDKMIYVFHPRIKLFLVSLSCLLSDFECLD